MHFDARRMYKYVKLICIEQQYGYGGSGHIPRVHPEALFSAKSSIVHSWVRHLRPTKMNMSTSPNLQRNSRLWCPNTRWESHLAGLRHLLGREEQVGEEVVRANVHDVDQFAIAPSLDAMVSAPVVRPRARRRQGRSRANPHHTHASVLGSKQKSDLQIASMKNKCHGYSLAMPFCRLKNTHAPRVQLHGLPLAQTVRTRRRC